MQAAGLRGWLLARVWACRSCWHANPAQAKAAIDSVLLVPNVEFSSIQGPWEPELLLNLSYCRQRNLQHPKVQVTGKGIGITP